MTRTIKPEDLLRLQLPGDPQVSPDGRLTAFVVARTEAEKNETRHRIYMVRTSRGAVPRPFTSGDCSDRQPRWSTDGTRLAFISNRSGKNQIWLIPAAGGEAVQVTRFRDGVVGPPVWSPDGRSIAFTAMVGGGAGGGVEGEPEDESDLYAKFTRGVKRITRIHYKLDGVGLLNPDKQQQVFVVSAEPGSGPRQVTRGPWNHRSPAWSPDGQALAFVANRRLNDDYTVMLSDIWVQSPAEPDSEVESEPVRITPEELSVFSPCWSPDGTQVAFLGHSWDRFRGYSSTRVWTVRRDGTGLRCLTTGWDRTFAPVAVYDVPGPVDGGTLAWTPDGSALMAIGSDSGRQQVYAIDAESGSVTALTAGDHVVTGWSSDAGRIRLVLCLTRPDLPGDLFLVEGPDLVRLTELNDTLFEELELAQVEEFRFGTGGGENSFLAEHGTGGLDHADGWVMKPAGFQEGKLYPAILEIHGGPMMMYGWNFFLEFQCLAAAGYAVIYTNPRGSQGYGERFCACIKEDWGNLDFRDVMAGLDVALARFPWIDQTRLGVAGGSYGGFMTNWIIGHTDRFRAAVTMRSVVNEASSVGTSDFGFVDMLSYPNPPWVEQSYYQRVSPISYVDEIHTPLLIEHQEEDHRCPIEQAEQLYTALKYLNRTVEFVRYPDSSHGMSRTGKPWLRIHRLRTIADWFGRFL